MSLKPCQMPQMRGPVAVDRMLLILYVGGLGFVVSGVVLMMVLAWATTAPAAIPPAPIDAAFLTGNEKDVATAITESEAFKRAVKEAVKTRDQRRGEIAHEPSKRVGITPEQAARVRFIQVLQGK